MCGAGRSASRAARAGQLAHVFMEGEGLRFQMLPVPTNADVLAILDRIMRRIARRLAHEAAADDRDADPVPDVLAQVQAEAAAMAFSCRRSCDRARRRAPARVVRHQSSRSLHADVVIADHDRAALERPCRYGARPGFAQERLSWTTDGRIASSGRGPTAAPSSGCCRSRFCVACAASSRRRAGIWFATAACSGPPQMSSPLYCSWIASSAIVKTPPVKSISAACDAETTTVMPNVRRVEGFRPSTCAHDSGTAETSRTSSAACE